MYAHMCLLSCFSCVQLSVTLWTVARQAPLSVGFSRQEYRVGCHALLQGISPTWGLGPLFLLSCTAGRFFTHWATWEVHVCVYTHTHTNTHTHTHTHTHIPILRSTFYISALRINYTHLVQNELLIDVLPISQGHNRNIFIYMTFPLGTKITELLKIQYFIQRGRLWIWGHRKAAKALIVNNIEKYVFLANKSGHIFQICLKVFWKRSYSIIF